MRAFKISLAVSLIISAIAAALLSFAVAFGFVPAQEQHAEMMPIVLLVVLCGGLALMMFCIVDCETPHRDP